jgi:PAS domain S-box-containing protein
VTVSDTLLSLESVLCTQELKRRPARAPEYARENRALLALAQALVDSPRTILQTLSDTLLTLLKADSAGLSLLTPDEQRFHWPAIAGMWKPHAGGGTPRESGPCGDVLDHNGPLLFRRFERRYPYLLAATPPAEECLLAPFYVDGRAVGTIWAMAHSVRRQFDAEDLRLLRSLGKFASAAYQATESLNTEKEFNRSIIDSSPDCIKVLDLEGNLLSMHSGQALLGIDDIRPFLNTSWIEFWRGGDREAARVAVEAAAAGRQGRFVGHFRARPGEPRWWDVAVSPMLDTNGQPARLLVVSREVTERKRAETNLGFLASVSQDLAQLTGLDETMAAVAAKIGAQFGLSLCAFVNIDESAEQVVISHDWHRADVPSLTGVHRMADFVAEEFIRTARAGAIIVVPDTAADPRTNPETFAALKIASFICVPLIRDAQWRFALCLYHSAPYRWRDDEIELARELTTRIWTQSERLRAEAALRVSEERYRNLFNSMDEGFCVIELILDGEGKGVDYRCLEMNPAFERQTGMADPQGRTMRELVPDSEADGIEKYNRVVLSGEPIRFVNKSNHLNRWFDIYAFRIGGPGSRKVAVIFNNITQRMQAQQSLSEAAQALADLDRRKDEFLAMLSHELRNPLAPISNAVKILQLQKDENPVQQQARTIIERQVGNLKHLIDDLLEISRISTGRIQLQRERIAVGRIVERAVETARPLIVQRRHEFTLSVPPQPLWLDGDAARLEQVVVNLLINAAKYTDQAGQIWLNVEEEGETVVLRVRDTGIGIAAELLPHIFDLFTQAQRSLDRAQGGLGIGLCLVQRLVDLHGGRVEVESVPGQGSEFVVRLPLMRASMASVAPSLLPVPVPPTEMAALPTLVPRVLVVDDNVDAAETLAILLQVSGHEMRTAYDGPAALDAALQFRPEVVLLDIGLPGLSGLDVARRIRKLAALENVVLVAMTGYGQATDREQSQEAGFDHHLVKPADFDEVQRILAGVAQNGRADVSGPS